MKVICQNCGQLLPKTILTCPNCGKKAFLPQTPLVQSVSAQQVPVQNPTGSPLPMQYNVPPTQQLNQQLNTAPISPAISQSVPQVAPQSTVYDGYMPPVAPPMPPVQATYTAPAVSVPQARPAPIALPPIHRQPLKPAHTMQYAGFVRRGFALAFDVILLSILLTLAWQQLRPLIRVNFNLGLTNASLAISSGVVYLLYTAFLTSRARQATIGKMMVGLWVYDMNGQRLGFWHALVREMIKAILLPFGFIMWFTARKQTLHDLIARTVVLLDP